jgi:hypothetical protein
VQYVQTWWRGRLGRTDVKRWENLGNYEVEWDERTRLIASLIPRNSRVIEFGAGRRQLEAMLDASCRYYLSDLVSRGPGTIVCDLNARPLPDLSDLRLDVAVFGGVLEYLSDLGSLPLWLARYVPVCIASYECAHSEPHTLSRMREVVRRAGIGWVNTYNERELKRLFERGDFYCEDQVIWKTESGDEPIFVFRKRW